MLEVKFLKRSLDFLLIELLAAIVGCIHVCLSYLELNWMVIEHTNSLRCLVKEIGTFGGFGDQNQVEKFFKRTWVRKGAACLEC